MIAFCTTCKGRAQHIERTLPRNLADNREGKFILLDYNSPDHLIEYLRQNHQREIEAGRLTVYSYREPGPFKMAHAKNMAHRLGILEGADILVNLDADNFTGPGFDEYIADSFQAAQENHEKMFMWTKMVKGKFPRGMSGRIIVTKAQFRNVGGYDERFEMWSPLY